MIERGAFEKWAQGNNLRFDGEAAWLAAIEWYKSQASAADEGREPLESLRSNGWMVAVHNDYMQAGEMFTFWLLTKGDRCIKGEAKTDTEALRICLSQAERDTTPPQTAKTLPTIEEMCGSIDFAGWPLPKAAPPQEVAAPMKASPELAQVMQDASDHVAKWEPWQRSLDPQGAPEVAVPADDYRADFDPDEIVTTLRQKLAAAERENATLRERNEELQKALNRAYEDAATLALEQRCERGTPWDLACVEIARKLRECKAALAPSAERKPEVKG